MKKSFLLCLCEGKAFTFVFQHVAYHNNAIFLDKKEAMMEKFCEEDYKGTLETKLRTKVHKRIRYNAFLAWN